MLFWGGGQSLKPSNNKHFGFTLAEVLITLGIIGVVAAITIPTLVTNYKEKVFVVTKFINKALSPVLSVIRPSRSWIFFKTFSEFFIW